MEQKPLAQRPWFRGTVAVLTLLSGIGLFAAAGMGIHTFASALIAFLCLMGLERMFSSLLGMLIVLLRSRRSNGA
jgi:hypothetical protein